MKFYISLIWFVPGWIIGTVILMKTKASEGPSWLLTLQAIMAFVQSIMWISFASNTIMDLLQIFGFITTLPEALLALTVVSWGNCLGDMAADVAMTKKGFGEMAITGCVAGPIFNVLVGLGLSFTLNLAKSKDPLSETVSFSLFQEDGDVNLVAILPLVLVSSQLIILLLIMTNGLVNKFMISFKFHFIALIYYAGVIIGLVIFCIVDDV